MDASKKEEGHRLSYRFRLYPTPDQERYFAVNFGCVRYVYNYFLKARIDAYEQHKKDPDNCKPLTLFDTNKALTVLKKETVDEEGRRWLYDADATALVYALRHLDNAYKHFFRRVKQGEKPGFPKFKSRYNANQSFTVGACKLDASADCVILPKIGQVKARIHREVKGEFVSATISKNPAGQYHIVINVKGADIAPLPKSDSVVGITMGVRKWVVTSDGQVFSNPQVFKKMEHRLAREQRRLARKQKGSANYQKQKQKVARVHNKIANMRAYETHNLTRQIVNENGIIVSREMSSGRMTTRPAGEKPESVKRKINRAIIDANFAEINRQLRYKSAWAGRTFVLLPADTPTAQVCSSCGYQHAEVGQDARMTWECPECGAVHDRHYNGAKNVLEAGLKVLSQEEASHVSEATPKARRPRKGRGKRDKQ